MDRLQFEANPWNDDEERRYGSTRRLLSLAHDLGYKFDRPEDAVQKQKVFESFDSVKMLSLMAEISAAEDKLNSINKEIGMILLDRETHDLTGLTGIESRLSSLAALSSHLGETVNNKSIITRRLQQPYSGENLLVDASLHRNVVEFFTMVSPLLSDLGNLLDTITWTASNAKDLPNRTDKALVKQNATLDAVTDQVEQLAKLRTTLQSLSDSYK